MLWEMVSLFFFIFLSIFAVFLGTGRPRHAILKMCESSSNILLPLPQLPYLAHVFTSYAVFAVVLRNALCIHGYRKEHFF